MQPAHADSRVARPLYTADERLRRDASRWTVVQGILAPLQFIACLVSVALVWRYLATGQGADAATVSVVIKTVLLYAIMITGSLWERDVFGAYLFVPAFFWEDVVSMLVMLLHTLYLGCLLFGFLSVTEQLYLALAAYAVYIVNAGQFLWKFRLARRAVSLPSLKSQALSDARVDTRARMAGV